MRLLDCFRSVIRSKASKGTSIRFQVLSDLHLEVGQQYKQYTFPAAAPYLILAGDIGRLADYEDYLAFLKKQVARFERVFLVLGNHEFYGSSHEASLDRALKLETEPCLQSKLILLHQKRFDIPRTNVTVLGCSLWSHIPDDAKLMVRMKINDFNKIQDWTPESHNEQHAADLRWLRDAVKERSAEKSSRGSQVIVVTHHAPCVQGTSEPRLDFSPWASAFSTDLLDKPGEGWPGVTTWVYGHTHYSTRFKKAGIKIVSNQRGYVVPDVERKEPAGYGQGKWKRFDDAFVLDMYPSLER